MLVAVADALLGTTLGLFASAFASTEFQVVQFLPALVFPQVLLGGILVPTDQMPNGLDTIAQWLPLTHAVNAFHSVATEADATADVWGQVGIVVAFAAAFVVAGSVTLRRRTP